MFGFNRPMVAAHRGFSARYPENTMVSFDAAVQAGAQMIELDVMLSRDEEVVVIHDSTVDRTSNGSGPVNRLTLRELKALDAGGWFHSGFSGERIPTLKEVLDIFIDRVLINIEMKNGDEASMVSPGVLEKKVFDLIRERKAEQRVLISSFHAEMLSSVLRLSGELPLALLVENGDTDEIFSLCKKLDVFSLHPPFEMVTGEMVALCRDVGIFVFVWNVLSENDVDACFQMGVDGVFADDPVMARQRVKSYFSL